MFDPSSGNVRVCPNLSCNISDIPQKPHDHLIMDCQNENKDEQAAY